MQFSSDKAGHRLHTFQGGIYRAATAGGPTQGSLRTGGRAIRSYSLFGSRLFILRITFLEGAPSGFCQVMASHIQNYLLAWFLLDHYCLQVGDSTFNSIECRLLIFVEDLFFEFAFGVILGH